MFDKSPAVGRIGAGGNHLGTRELGFWSILIVAVAYWANVVRATSPGDMPDGDAIITRILDNGAFDVVAWIMIFTRCGGLTEARTASRRQIGTAFLAGAIALAPVRLAAASAFVIVSGLLLTDRRTLRAGREVALLLLGMVFETIWTSPVLALPHMMVAHLDARVCALVLGLFDTATTAHANVVTNADTGFSVAVWPYCTSSYPLAAVCLAFLVTLLYLGQIPRPRHVLWLSVSLVGSVLLTEIRLVVLGTSEANYFWWHDGPGASIYVLAALGLAIVFPILAAWRKPAKLETLAGDLA